MKRKTNSPRRPAGGVKRVLVVDRDSGTSTLCRAALAGKDCIVETHTSAVAAITAARRHPPDLVLVSLQLGDASGAEVVEWLRSTPELQAAPIIALTAMADDYGRLLGSGIATVLRKPLTIAAIRRAVRGVWLPPATEVTL
ncbi:MAG: response regulator [Alphaproteobacteria bacterium]|nr:response regulator [Alphaproteobacteria bacterium]